MDESILVSKGNSVVVSNNPPGEPFHSDGDALILDQNLQNGIHCQLVLGGRMVVSPQIILQEKNIETISRQQGCHTASHQSFHSTHHSHNRLINAAEKRDLASWTDERFACQHWWVIFWWITEEEWISQMEDNCFNDGPRCRMSWTGTRLQNMWWVLLRLKYTSTKLQPTINNRNKR